MRQKTDRVNIIIFVVAIMVAAGVLTLGFRIKQSVAPNRNGVIQVPKSVPKQKAEPVQ